jgi:hypothetical protein
VREILTPKGLALRGIVLTALFLAAHLAGLRSFTSILCGMSSSAGGTASVTAFLGSVYVVLYLAAVSVAPILLIAAGLLFLWDRGKAAAVRASTAVQPPP